MGGASERRVPAHLVLHSSKMRASWIVFLVALFSLAQSASGYVKKSDITEFASAINGAGRLRYGKRANWESLYPESAFEEEDAVAAAAGAGSADASAYQYDKRAPVPSNLLQSLNGAERLRFGKK